MVRAFLKKLKALDIHLWAEGDWLKWDAPVGLVKGKLEEEMRNNKAELLALLRNREVYTYNHGYDSESSKEENHQVDLEAEDIEKKLLLNANILGDCLNKLKTIPDNSIDLIVTDPPYGIKFMGKKWDKAIPNIDIWKECLRVLKAGAFAFIMSSPRQDQLSRMIINLEDAGFQVGFSSLYWTFASGFPKARNISKAIDKRLGVEREKLERNPNSRENCDKSNTIYKSGTVGKTSYHTKPVTEEAKKLDGSYAGFQPKPAVEVIIVAMKPCNEKTHTDQALSNGKGITWLDDCRIPYADDGDFNACDKKQKSFHGAKNIGSITEGKTTFLNGDIKVKAPSASNSGRFPANLVVSDDIIDDCKKNKSGDWSRNKNGRKCIVSANNDQQMRWKQIDEQPNGYSRFFSLDSWAKVNLQDLPETVQRNLPFLIVPKASKKEKDAGLEQINIKSTGNKGNGLGRVCEHCGAPQLKPCDCEPKSWINPKVKNNHPTVKSIKLMAYLITMGSRENDIILDPFSGTGSTCIAAKMLNRNYIGIEISSEYHEIADLRIENANKDNTIIKLIRDSLMMVKNDDPEKNKNAKDKEKLKTHNVCSEDAE